MKQYRLLKVGEIVKKGDECKSANETEWRKMDDFVGQETVSIDFYHGNQYRRRKHVKNPKVLIETGKNVVVSGLKTAHVAAPVAPVSPITEEIVYRYLEEGEVCDEATDLWLNDEGRVEKVRSLRGRHGYATQKNEIERVCRPVRMMKYPLGNLSRYLDKGERLIEGDRIVMSYIETCGHLKGAKVGDQGYGCEYQRLLAKTRLVPANLMLFDSTNIKPAVEATKEAKVSSTEDRPLFIKALKNLINSYSKENGSNTSDFILARYMVSCLYNFDRAVKDRDLWYGVDLKPGCSAGFARQFASSGLLPEK